MKSFRNIVFWLHLVGGCVAGVVILTMSVTGALLAFERQIMASMDAPVVLQNQSGALPETKLEPILTALQNSGRGVPSELVLHNSTKAPVEARFGRQTTLFLNPWTAEIIGRPNENLRGFFGSTERIHRSLGLGMQNAMGRGIVGAANLIFLFMVVSGFYLWMPKVFSFAALRIRLLFRSGIKGRTREWNWHHVIGMWTSIPLFFIVLTGVIMSYPWASNLLFTMTGSPVPTSGLQGPRGNGAIGGAQRGPLANDLQAGNYRSIDELVQTAKQQTPAWKSISVTVPRPQDRMLNLSIDKSVGGQPEQAFQMVINRQSGNVEALKRFSDNSTGRKLRSWSRFLHTGEELGLFGQIIGAIACLGAIMLVWTGISMALRRALARFESPSETEQESKSDTEAVAN